MQINDNRKRANPYFNSNYRVGSVFDYAGDIYMMIEEIRDEDGMYYNTVCLNDGKVTHFYSEEVQILDNVILEIY